MTSPGRSPKNFLPTFEFTTELVKKPETFTTPERIPVATFSDIFVTLFTLEEDTHFIERNKNKGGNKFIVCTNQHIMYCHKK